MAVQAPTETRDLILDATDTLMQRYGFRKMTMDDIAREAGISKRTIYTHFPSKEEVGLSSIARVVGRAHTEMLATAKSTASHSDRLKQMLVVRVMVRVESVRDYRESLDGLFEAVRPAYMLRRQASFRQDLVLIAELIQEGVSAGEFEASDAETDAAAMLRATSAYLPYSLSVAELGDTKAIRAGVGAIAELMIRGLQKSGTTR
ncbi:MAG: TetR/AcrR family transcriptional regulator [Fimbriimonadales bacterium]